MDSAALFLSRIQFAFTISFHIIFLAFTIGLAAWLTVLEALHLRTVRSARQPPGLSSSNVNPNRMTVALVGPSGDGKSAILALAAGVLTPDSGAVALGGDRLARPGMAAYGGRIGYLLQRTELFRGSIADNLLLGRPDANDDKLQIAVAAVGLDLAIANLSKGLHHQLGDGGTGLSGGERRRLGIARLLVASPDVYVFDEATEGLDAATAALVIDSIRLEARGRAVLLATHHRNEADNADTLLWIERGKLTQKARRGETVFDAILDQLNPRSCRCLDPGRGDRLAEQGGRILAAGLVGAG